MAFLLVSDVTKSPFEYQEFIITWHTLRLYSVCLTLQNSPLMSTMSKKRTIDSFFTPPAKQRKVDEHEAQEEPVCLR